MRQHSALCGVASFTLESYMYSCTCVFFKLNFQLEMQKKENVGLELWKSQSRGTHKQERYDLFIPKSEQRQSSPFKLKNLRT